ncbi:MAG: hypothetical protein PF588_09480 [Candidatus Kapabacteria bacterium]|jgi:DNA-binding transcriptional regulator GbsR (MarR family)|nr:hypothetical protein [Candidatus Kapabacteria bacterium]
MSTTNHDKLLLEVEEYMTEEFANYFDKMGAKRLFGRIFGLLIVQLRPISLKECAAKLKVSKPAVSTTMNMGVQMDMFLKTQHPDFPRESFYSIGIEFMEMIIDPGIAKLNMLNDKIWNAMRMLQESKYAKDSEIKKISERVEHLYKGFNVTIEEYKIFGDKIKQRIRDLHKPDQNSK